MFLEKGRPGGRFHKQLLKAGCQTRFHINIKIFQTVDRKQDLDNTKRHPFLIFFPFCFYFIFLFLRWRQTFHLYLLIKHEIHDNDCYLILKRILMLSPSRMQRLP